MLEGKPTPGCEALSLSLVSLLDHQKSEREMSTLTCRETCEVSRLPLVSLALDWSKAGFSTSERLCVN